MEVIKQKKKSWKLFAYGGVVLFFLVSFWNELSIISASIFENVISVDVYQAIGRLLFGFFVFFVFFHLSVFLVAQFALPVNAWDERKKAANSFLLFFGGKHGPAIFVKDGIVVEGEGERDKKGAGVALINLNSVLVLQGNLGVPKQLGHWVGDEIKMPTPSKNFSLKSLLPKKKKQKKSDLFRVVGPGIAFIGKKEDVFRSFDLRNQGGKRDVFARTSDGVKVFTTINVGISLNSDLDVIQVAYVGGKMINNIKGVELLEDVSRGVVGIERVFDLDYDDIAEIAEKLSGGEKNKELAAKKKSLAYSRFRPYFEDRIKILAYAILRGKEDTNWLELPLDVAEGIFIRLLSTKAYEKLYSFGDGKQFPLEDYFKRKFIQRVKRQGLLSFQFVQRKDGNAFSGVGEEISLETIEKMPAREFRSSGSRKILRRYGLKVNVAGFGDLKPVDGEITQQVIARWHARWKNKIKKIEASNRLKAMRTLNATRAQMQKDMAYLLSDIYDSDPHSEEALALRAFQALETAAADRSDELAPKEIMLTLQNLYQWFVLERQNSSNDNDFSKKWIRRD